MGVLETSGIVSGLGQGLSQGLQSMQQGIIQSGILDERERRADLRAGADRAFQEMKMREQHAFEERLKGKEIDSADTRAQAQLTSQEGIHSGDRTSREGMAKDSNAMHLKIAEMTNDVHLKIANAKNALDKETNTRAEMNTLAKVIGDAEQEITRIKVELLKPLVDQNAPDVKLLQEGLRKAETDKEAFKVRYRELTGTKPPTAEKPVEKKSFNPGTYGTTSGTRTVPAPAPGILDSMGRALQGR